MFGNSALGSEILLQRPVSMAPLYFNGHNNMNGDKWFPMLSIKEHCSAEWVLHGKENYRSVRKMNEVE